MIVRQETSEDVGEVRDVVTAAFDQNNGDEPVEATLLDQLRKCDGWIPTLSLVAIIDDHVVGHAVCTRGNVGENRCLGLGPIGVLPALQRRGIGSALMHTMLGVADGVGEPLVALLGSPDYYGRFGFVPSKTLDIEPPESQWGDNFQIRTLNSFDQSIHGTFIYAEPFSRL